MKKILKLNTLKEVRTMTDPYRTKIILIFQQNDNKPMTIKDIAQAMGDPHGTVDYHVKKMLKLHAFEVVKTEKINGILSKYYRLSFDEINSNYEVSSHEEVKIFNNAYTTAIKTYFDKFRDGFMNFIESVDDRSHTYKPGEKRSYLSGHHLYFDEKDYSEFQTDLEDLLKKYAVKKNGEDVFEKTMFYAVYSELQSTQEKEI